jgi:beta-galactosidase
MLEKHPDMLAIDKDGRPRKFGSRRHYCFSHEGYRDECIRIVTLIAERYGKNSYVGAWQTDNEYSCHDTTHSFSASARSAFKNWLRVRYAGSGNNGDISALNKAWGNIFWSMEYESFDQIDLPNLTVTQPNPSHVLDFRRFCSDQVVSFNLLQTEIIKSYSNAPITHNFMGKTTEFDHFKVGDDLDIASWDSYPLGFLEDRVLASDEFKRAFYRQGDPDFQAFHHDLYRSVGKGRWWVMEQQPGPVNWAPYNPAPLPGMVRLWSWEAFAHGAEAVCYFRWRQAPFAQEQKHAGLLRPDNVDAPALAEAVQVAKEIVDAPVVEQCISEVALLFDYQSDWMWQTLPQGRGLEYFNLVYDNYRALRRLGLSVDMLSTYDDFSKYKLVVAPGLMHMNDDLKNRLSKRDGPTVVGPRSGSSTENLGVVRPLGPNLPHMNVTATRVETLRPDMPILLKGGGSVKGWSEVLEASDKPFRTMENGDLAAIASGNLTYLGGWFDDEALTKVFSEICSRAEIEIFEMPEGLRRRVTSKEMFWFNYGTNIIEFQGRSFLPQSVTRDLI